MVVHTFNPSAEEAEATWSTEHVPEKPQLHRETLSQKGKKKSLGNTCSFLSFFIHYILISHIFMFLMVILTLLC